MTLETLQIEILRDFCDKISKFNSMLIAELQRFYDFCQLSKGIIETYGTGVSFHTNQGLDNLTSIDGRMQ